MDLSGEDGEPTFPSRRSQHLCVDASYPAKTACATEVDVNTLKEGRIEVRTSRAKARAAIAAGSYHTILPRGFNRLLEPKRLLDGGRSVAKVHRRHVVLGQQPQALHRTQSKVTSRTPVGSTTVPRATGGRA